MRLKLDVLFGALSIVGVAFLVFVVGAWVTWKGLFPFDPYLKDAFRGAEALRESRELTAGQPKQSGFWDKAREGERIGVVRLDRERAFPGLTLVVAGDSAHLVELDGRVRHSWHLDYEAIQDEQAVVRRRANRGQLYWRPARVLPDGDLLVIFDSVAFSPAGLALARLDRDSRPRWVFHGHVHHDFDVAPDGSIYVLAQGLRKEPPKNMRPLQGPLLEERLYVLSPEGKLLKDFSILEAFSRSPYRGLVNLWVSETQDKRGDYLHSNNVDYVEASDARFPFAKPGQVLISMRNLHTVAVMDLEKERITWARTGEWHRQHDPDILENGNLLIFDNRGDADHGSTARVIEYDPRTSAIVWQFPGESGEKLVASFRGDQQRLPNGNVLIDVYNQGRVLEVTPGGEVVWEYRCPFRFELDTTLRCKVLYTERYAPGTLSFPFNEGRISNDDSDEPAGEGGV